MSWRVASALLALRDQINAKWPERSKTSDGTIGDERHQTRDSDHNPWVREGGNGIVTAMDITNDPLHGGGAQAIVNALVASRDPRIKYIIWNKHICASYNVHGEKAWTWRPYYGSNPHIHHFHISVRPEKEFYDDRKPWSIG